MTSLLQRFHDKIYRDEFVSSSVDTGLAFQIFAMREQRQWSQKQLAQEAGGGLQPGVSRWERPGHRFSLATLKKIASAFDVALIVRFVPFSELARWAADIRPGAFEVPSFDQEVALTAGLETKTRNKVAIFRNKTAMGLTFHGPDRLVSSETKGTQTEISLENRTANG